MKGCGRALLGLSLALWLLGPACSLVVGVDQLEEGCEEGQKPCELELGKLSCVSSAEPEHGCGRDSCVPCTLPHAIEVCSDGGECAVGTCEPGYENCDLIAKNGCEVALDTSYDACGSCDNSCEDAVRNMPRAVTAECRSGRCKVGECEQGYQDCDGASSNGCEKPLAESDCGRCDGCPGQTRCNLETRRCE